MKTRNLIYAMLIGAQTIGVSGCFTALNNNSVLGHPGDVGSTIEAAVLDIATLPLQVAVVSVALGCVAVYELPVGGDEFTVRVRDEDGNPVVGAEIHGCKSGGPIESKVLCRTDANGEVTFRHYRDGQSLSRAAVSREGYDSYQRSDSNNSTVSFFAPGDRKPGENGRIVYDVVLKKVNKQQGEKQ